MTPQWNKRQEKQEEEKEREREREREYAEQHNDFPLTRESIWLSF